MGLQAVYASSDPVAVVRDALNTPDEIARREEYRTRTALLEENSKWVIEREIGKLFRSESVVARMTPWAEIAGSQSLARRTTTEVTRSIYSIPPTRYLSEGEEPYKALVKETHLNQRMRLAVARGWFSNHAWLYTRYVERLQKMIIDVLLPECVPVIPDPDDLTKELSITYDYPRRKPDGTWVMWHVTWDDEITFTLDEKGGLVPQKDPRTGGMVKVREHGYPRMPILGMHFTDRAGCFWDRHTGKALIASSKGSQMLVLLSFRLLKAQGFNLQAIIGDMVGQAKGQVLDEESAVALPAGTEVASLVNKQDADHYITMLDAVKNSAAADVGISRARLNQDKAEASDDTGLMESRHGLIGTVRDVEFEQFEVMQMISQEHPTAKIPLTARMETVDFGEIQHRVDRLTQLAIWEKELSKGLRSVYDCIREDNPEITTDEEAQAEIERNAGSVAWFVDLYRKLNIRTDGGTDKPGQTAEANGRMGPKVRDGEMTGDEAAAQAKGAPDDDEEDEEAYAEA